MSSSSTERMRRRQSKKSSLYYATVKEKARLAVQQAALEVSQNFSAKSQGYHQHAAESMESSEDASEEKSVQSAELAIRRGSLRAMSEMTDHVVEGDDDDEEDLFLPAAAAGLDLDLTTITEDVTTTPSRSRQQQRYVEDDETQSRKSLLKRAGRIARRKKKKPAARRAGVKKSSAKKKKGSASGEAWMCGCCGKVFSSVIAADIHEDKCIRAMLRKIGVDVDDAQPPTTKQQQHLESRRLRSSTIDVADVHQQRMSALIEPQDLTTRHHSNHLRSMVADASNQHNNNKTARRSRRRISSDTDLLHLALPAVDEDLLLPQNMRQYIVLTDEALVNAVERATKLLLTPQQVEAERRLALLARDKAWYDGVAERAHARATRKTEYHRTEGSGVLSKVHNKFVDAYQLIKEGDEQGGMTMDQYTRKSKGGDGGGGDIVHNDDTLYVNVVVKHSIQVVNNELERLAKERWEDQVPATMDNGTARFERFRAIAHGNLVKLAGLALASDFTPRRVAVQLSNDLYRLIVPQLKKRGVTIETEIEYRVGPYFVLAVNVKKINWTKLMKATHREKLIQMKRWERERELQIEHLQQGAESTHGSSDNGGDVPKDNLVKCAWRNCKQLTQITGEQAISTILSWLYHLHWSISVPICSIFYFVFFRTMMRRYVLMTVTDDVFRYIEEKGMEMEIQVQEARKQAAFMLSALRELRVDSRERQKKLEEAERAAKGLVLGPLLGPAIKDDKGPAPPVIELPENLEFVGLEVDLPVGFKRLRWAILSSKSQFIRDAFFAAEAKYNNIKVDPWSKHDEHIGLPVLPAGVNEEEFLNAERETEFLMPKSAFVKANMAFERNMITAYNDNCFCLKKRTLNPDVPYGSTFVAWTQILITNTGNDTCRMVCSVEAEFPNGPPLVSRQIKSGMRAGTAEVFVLMAETIEKYADEYP